MEALNNAFIEQLKEILPESYQELIQTLDGEAPVSVRLNPSKKAELDLPLEERIPWTSMGYYLKKRPSFTLDPLFQAGAYYVQEASSMLIEQALVQVLDQSQAVRALDLCAAPGGKSTLLSSLLPQDSLLVTNEVIGSRYKILIENMQKWGQCNQVVTNHDAKDFQNLKGFFDLLLIDAPCSGEGMFRKDKNSRSEWSENNVNLCSARQRRILGETSELLREDGILIYSTCTYNREENEQNVRWLQDEFEMELCPLDLDERWGLEDTGYGYQAFPHRCKGEGFFMAVLRKTSPSSRKKIKHKKGKGPKGLDFISKKEADSVSGYFKTPEQLCFYINHKEELCFIPANLKKDIDFLCQQLYRYTAGTTAGQLKHGKLIPHHALAMSTALSPDLPAMDLDKKTALNYLRKENIANEEGKPQGWHLMRYEGLNLGWGKILKDRINNYYPKHLRIRMKAD